MRSLALHGALRRQLTWLHRWSGLVVLFFLLVASLTGTWLVFRDELDRRINPHLRVVAIGRELVPLRDIYAQVERQFPGTQVSTVILQKHADDALIVYFRRAPPELPFDHVYVDPYTGRILGTRSSSRITYSKESLDPLIFRMHYTLLLGQSGLWLMGGCAIVWLVTNLIGLALSWPQAWRRLFAWIPILSVRLRSGSYKVNYDAHRAIGVWLLPIFTVLAFTSVYLNLPQLIRPAVNAFSPLSKSPATQSKVVGAATLTPDQAIEIARADVPDGRPNSVYRDFDNGSYSVWLQRADDPSPYGNNAVYIDFSTGAVKAARIARTESAGDRFIDWQFPLHTGMAFGLPGRIIIALSGVSMVGLSVTGFYVWLRKWRTRRAARSRARAVAPAPAAAGRRDPQPTPVAARERVLQPGRSA